MVGVEGIEPSSNWLKASHSATELHPRKNGRGRGIRTPARSSQGSRATVEHYPTENRQGVFTFPAPHGVIG